MVEGIRLEDEPANGSHDGVIAAVRHEGNCPSDRGEGRTEVRVGLKPGTASGFKPLPMGSPEVQADVRPSASYPSTLGFKGSQEDK